MKILAKSRILAGIARQEHSCRRQLSQSLPRLANMSHYPVDDRLFGLSEEQSQLRETAFKFCQKELAPFAQEIDRNDDFAQRQEFWLKMGQMGLLGITADPKYGGSGMGILDHCIVGEEISRVHAGVALSCGAHSNLCINQLDKNGSEEQKERFLPSLCKGQLTGALAMSEAGSGSDVLSMKTRAVATPGGDFVLNGSKFWITNGPVADVVIVYAKTNPSSAKPQHGITAFIVEKGMKGFKQGPKLDKLGLRGSPTGELVFEDCLVPKANVLGRVDRGVQVLMSGLDVERIILCCGPIGIMQACCDVSWHYAHQREQFGQKIAEFQLIQAKIADMYTNLASCRSYLYNVARMCDVHGAAKGKDCAAAALLCGEKATQMALEAIQILGGNGYINDYPTGRLLRDAKLFEIGGGTSEVRRLVIGRSVNAEYLS